jgi:hypothetical protein
MVFEKKFFCYKLKLIIYMSRVVKTEDRQSAMFNTHESKIFFQFSAYIFL